MNHEAIKQAIAAEYSAQFPGESAISPDLLNAIVALVMSLISGGCAGNLKDTLRAQPSLLRHFDEHNFDLFLALLEPLLKPLFGAACRAAKKATDEELRELVG